MLGTTASLPFQSHGQEGFGLLVDSALRRQGNDGLDGEARLDIPGVIVGISKGRGIGGAEKKPDGIEDGRLADIAAAKNYD